MELSSCLDGSVRQDKVIMPVYTARTRQIKRWGLRNESVPRTVFIFEPFIVLKKTLQKYLVSRQKFTTFSQVL